MTSYYEKPYTHDWGDFRFTPSIYSKFGTWIYYIVVNDTLEQYVGQTCNSLEQRLYQHKMTNSKIGRAIKKHGAKIYPIERCDKEIANDREGYYIDLFNTMEDITPFGLNRRGAGIYSRPSKQLSEEMSEKYWIRYEEKERKLHAEMEKYWAGVIG